MLKLALLLPVALALRGRHETETVVAPEGTDKKSAARAEVQGEGKTQTSKGEVAVTEAHAPAEIEEPAAADAIESKVEELPSVVDAIAGSDVDDITKSDVVKPIKSSVGHLGGVPVEVLDGHNVVPLVSDATPMTGPGDLVSRRPVGDLAARGRVKDMAAKGVKPIKNVSKKIENDEHAHAEKAAPEKADAPAEHGAQHVAFIAANDDGDKDEQKVTPPESPPETTTPPASEKCEIFFN